MENKINKLLKNLLFTFIGVYFSQTNLQANEQDTLISKIESKYIFTHKKNSLGFFILKNGYTLYFYKKNTSWNIGDKLIIEKPYPQGEDDFDSEEFLSVINQTQDKKSLLLYSGWCDKNEYVISSKSHKVIDDEYVVFIYLNNGTKLKIMYSDEKPYAKNWKKGDRVIVIINTFTDSNGYYGSPFPISTYNPNWHYEIVNLDAKHHLPSGFVKIIP